MNLPQLFVVLYRAVPVAYSFCLAESVQGKYVILVGFSLAHKCLHGSLLAQLLEEVICYDDPQDLPLLI